MTKNVRVLVIDSEPDFVRNIRKELGSHCDLISAAGADEALKIAGKNKPDIIVLGYIKPPGASFKLHLKFRQDKNFQDIPLLIVDVRPEEHSRKGWSRTQGQQMDADDYLSKPVTSEDLKEAIERLVSKKPGESIDSSKYLERVLQKIKRIEKTLFN
jgi:PleD family two-component response regulator